MTLKSGCDAKVASTGMSSFVVGYGYSMWSENHFSSTATPSSGNLLGFPPLPPLVAPPLDLRVLPRPLLEAPPRDLRVLCVGVARRAR